MWSCRNYLQWEPWRVQPDNSAFERHQKLSNRENKPSLSYPVCTNHSYSKITEHKRQILLKKLNGNSSRVLTRYWHINWQKGMVSDKRTAKNISYYKGTFFLIPKYEILFLKEKKYCRNENFDPNVSLLSLLL